MNVLRTRLFPKPSAFNLFARYASSKQKEEQAIISKTAAMSSLNTQGHAVNKASDPFKPEDIQSKQVNAGMQKKKEGSDDKMDGAISGLNPTEDTGNLKGSGFEGSMADSRGGRTDDISHKGGSAPASEGGADSEIAYAFGQRKTRAFSTFARRRDESVPHKDDGFAIPTVQITDDILHGKTDKPEYVEKGDSHTPGRDIPSSSEALNGAALKGSTKQAKREYSTAAGKTESTAKGGYVKVESKTAAPPGPYESLDTTVKKVTAEPRKVPISSTAQDSPVKKVVDGLPTIENGQFKAAKGSPRTPVQNWDESKR